MIDSETPDPLDDATIKRLSRIDLNLLVVFAALMQSNSVTLAAGALFVGQPAVSASLKRLRTLFGDPLFVKQGRSMAATERAVALKPLVDATLASIAAFASHPGRYEPAASRRVFHLGLSDDNELVFLPTILRRIEDAAPHVRVVARAVSHRDVRERLDAGEIDVAMSVFATLSPWHGSTVLYRQGYGCLFDPRHWRGRTRLTMRDYTTCRQAIVTFDGELRGRIDDELAARGLARNVVLGTSRFAALPALVAGSALVASVPELIGRSLAGSNGLAYARLPFGIEPGRPSLAWHRRAEADPASRWLRTLIVGAVREVVAATRRAP